MYAGPWYSNAEMQHYCDNCDIACNTRKVHILCMRYCRIVAQDVCLVHIDLQSLMSYVPEGLGSINENIPNNSHLNISPPTVIYQWMEHVSVKTNNLTRGFIFSNSPSRIGYKLPHELPITVELLDYVYRKLEMTRRIL